MLSNTLAFTLTSIECLAYVELCNWLAKSGRAHYTLTRKLNHIGCGLQYMLFWPLFHDSLQARAWCASVPVIAALRYLVVGLGVVHDQRLITSTSRSGDRKDLLKGPVVYGMLHGAYAFFFWRDSPVGILALTIVCSGDGLADIVGRRFGQSNRWEHNPAKSKAGSAACFLGGMLSGLVYLYLFQAWGYFQLSGSALEVLCKVAAVSAVSTAVESLAIADWDNLTVGMTAAASGVILFGW